MMMIMKMMTMNEIWTSHIVKHFVRSNMFDTTQVNINMFGH